VAVLIALVPLCSKAVADLGNPDWVNANVLNHLHRAIPAARFPVQALVLAHALTLFRQLI